MQLSDRVTRAHITLERAGVNCVRVGDQIQVPLPDECTAVVEFNDIDVQQRTVWNVSVVADRDNTGALGVVYIGVRGRELVPLLTDMVRH